MKLKEYIKNKKIKFEDFAGKIGCGQPHLSLICLNQRRPSPDLALKIQKATNGAVTVMELLYPETQGQQPEPN